MKHGLVLTRVSTSACLFTWMLALTLASAASVSCLMGAVQLDQVQHHCAGMSHESPSATIKSNCCRAGDLKAVAAPAAAALECPSSAIVAMLAPIEPKLTTRCVAESAFEPDTPPPIRIPTYLAVSSLRL